MTDLIEQYDGRLLAIGDELHEVRGRIKGRSVVGLKAPDGTLHEISSEDFRLRVASGLVLQRNRNETASRIPSDTDNLEAAFRKAVLSMTVRLERDGFDWQERHRLMEDHFSNHPEFRERRKPFPGVRAIQKWRKAFQEQSTSALHDKRYLSGNRTPRHSSLFEEIVLDVLESEYTQHDRMTRKAAWLRSRAEYEEVCSRKGIKPGPCGQKVVNSIIESLPHNDIVKTRIGGREGRKQLIEANRFVKVTRPMERIEIDSTKADIFVRLDESGTVGRPWMCAAIDCATGVIVGLEISIANPTATTTAKVLKEILTPKDEEFFEQHLIKNRFQTFGRPMQIVVDQGSENSGEIIENCVKNACLLFSSNLPGHPEDKPFIERFFRTLNIFLTTLPGATTTKDMPNRSRIEKATKEAVLTLDEFISVIQRWRYDVYTTQPRRRIENPLRNLESPKSAWERLDEEYIIPEPPTPREVAQLFYGGHAERTLHHYGIEFERIQYASGDLSRLRQGIGKGCKLAIRYDPTDLRVIGVVHPDTGETIFVPTKDRDFPALSIDDVRLIRKNNAPSSDEILSAQRAIAAIHGQFHHKNVSGTLARRAQKTAARKHQDQQIAERSKVSPEIELAVGFEGQIPAHKSKTLLRSSKSRKPLEIKPKKPK